MEANKQITANTQLGVYVKQMESGDKAVIIAATNKYVNSKRSNGNVEAAYNELLNTIKAMESKYGFNAFEENADVKAIIEEFAAKVEQGTNLITGKTSYTCNFKSTEEANIWLAGQNNVVIKKMSVATTGAGHKVTNITFEYVVSEQPLNNKYQVTEVTKTRFYLKSNPEKFRRKWQEKNPQYTFITSVARHYAMRLVGGNAGFIKIINEKHIVLYSFKCN